MELVEGAHCGRWLYDMRDKKAGMVAGERVGQRTVRGLWLMVAESRDKTELNRPVYILSHHAQGWSHVTQSIAGVGLDPSVAKQ